MTTRQQKFVEFYSACGNASEAAKRAGYKTKSNVIGAKLLAKDSIKQKINKIAEKDSKKRIATARDIKEFLSKVMEDETQDMKDRLKASDLLGKTKALYIEKREITGQSTMVIMPTTKDEPVK